MGLGSVGSSANSSSASSTSGSQSSQGLSANHMPFMSNESLLNQGSKNKSHSLTCLNSVDIKLEIEVLYRKICWNVHLFFSGMSKTTVDSMFASAKEWPENFRSLLPNLGSSVSQGPSHSYPAQKSKFSSKFKGCCPSNQTSCLINYPPSYLAHLCFY